MLLRHHSKIAAITLLTGAAIAGTASFVKAQSYTDFLASGDSVTYEGYFLADEDIYGSCDENCEDLDIYLYDAFTGELIESDTLADANPIVTAPYDGDFLVETVMVTCYSSACETWVDSDYGF
ncbi:MAG: hypothetical protein F6K42_02550 [Leptolyngbya sp. SIO1D8]|nr:hypothetical protein [Leptolyngbya sp. SIO1D8]